MPKLLATSASALIALAALCAPAPRAVAEIPTTVLGADGGPDAPVPKAKTPRTEQRAVERPPAVPSPG